MTSRLLAIKITGRTVAAAVYVGRELHFIQCRKLPSDLRPAKDSIVGLTSSLIEHFLIDSTVSEEALGDTRARALASSVLDLLREKAIPYWPIGKDVLFEAFGESSIKTTQQMRTIVGNYWPHIIDGRDHRTCLDAAAVGLYFQTERMLSDNSSLSP